MSNLFANDEVKKVDLDDEYWVSIRTNASVDEMNQVTLKHKAIAKGEANDIDAVIELIVTFVKDWNVLDENADPFPIDYASIRKLRFGVLLKLSKLISEHNEDLAEMMPKDEAAMKALMDKKKVDTAA